MPPVGVREGMPKLSELPKDGPLLDLTLREAAEAERYGLTVEDYDELRKAIARRVREQITEEVKDTLGTKVRGELRTELIPLLKEEIKPEVEKSIRPKLTEEVKAKYRTELEGAIKAEARKEAEQALTDKNHAVAPTSDDVYNYIDVARQLEVDCRVMADVASQYASRARTLQLFTNYVLRTIGFIGLVMSLPVGLYLYYVAHLGTNTLWCIGGAQVLGLFATFVLCGVLGQAAEKKIQIFGKVSSKFLAVADLARYKHIFEVSTRKNMHEMATSLDDLRRSKGSAEEQFYPHTQDIAHSRVRVLKQLNESMDTERVLRMLDAPSAHQNKAAV